MTLDSTQLTTLKTHIDASADLNTLPDNADGDIAIAALLNIDASPDFTVWKTHVAMKELLDNIIGESLITLPTDKGTGLNTLTVAHIDNGYNPSIAGNRDIFLDSAGQDGLFTGGANSNPTTRTQLEALFKRLATRGEGLYATGTGSNAVPGDLVVEGDISRQDVRSARNLP